MIDSYIFINKKFKTVKINENKIKLLNSLSTLIDSSSLNFSFNQIESISNIIFENQTSKVQTLISNNTFISGNYKTRE